MEWIAVKDSLPEEGKQVWTKIDDEKGIRNVAKLRRKGRMWLMENRPVYVYYRPTHWKPIV